MAGLELRELNALERELLFLLRFRLAVSRSEYYAVAGGLAAGLYSKPAAAAASAPRRAHATVVATQGRPAD